MLRYMLDTDICSYVMKRSHDPLPGGETASDTHPSNALNWRVCRAR